MPGYGVPAVARRCDDDEVGEYRAKRHEQQRDARGDDEEATGHGRGRGDRGGRRGCCGGRGRRGGRCRRCCGGCRGRRRRGRRPRASQPRRRGGHPAPSSERVRVRGTCACVRVLPSRLSVAASWGGAEATADGVRSVWLCAPELARGDAPVARPGDLPVLVAVAFLSRRRSACTPATRTSPCPSRFLPAARR